VVSRGNQNRVNYPIKPVNNPGVITRNNAASRNINFSNPKNKKNPGFIRTAS
jgi:hypothetical protein